MSVHPNFFKVTNVGRDREGRVTGTFSEYAKPLLFGIIRLPLSAIDIQFILTVDGNKVHYAETVDTTLGLTIEQTYVAEAEEMAVKVIDTFSCTCPWIFAHFISDHAKEVHSQLLINLKDRLVKARN